MEIKEADLHGQNTRKSGVSRGGCSAERLCHLFTDAFALPAVSKKHLPTNTRNEGGTVWDGSRRGSTG